MFSHTLNILSHEISDSIEEEKEDIGEFLVRNNISS